MDNCWTDPRQHENPHPPVAARMLRPGACGAGQRRPSMRASLVIAAMLASAALHAETSAAYKAGKERIVAELKVDMNACALLKGDAKGVCVAQANAKQKVAWAELEFGTSDKPADVNRVSQARAEAAYSVAGSLCNAKAGNAKDVCVKEAKAIEAKALIDAKASQKVREIQLDAAQEKRDADYKVAAEKCDTLAGDSKDKCIADAKVRFGQT
jgi:hypothetical protein